MMRSLESEESMFWPLQLGGWSLYGLANLIGSIPYLHHEPHYVAYRTTFLIVGFFTSFLTHLWCRRIRLSEGSLVRTLLASSVVCYALGLTMSASASTAVVLIGGPSVDLGWSSILAAGAGGTFVQVAWGALYFAIKHHAANQVGRTALLIAESSARSAQLEALRYQLQPHFLFNTLNAISTLVITGQSELASEMLEKLADVLRATLEKPDVNVVTLRDEIASTRRYLAIEQVRFGPKLEVHFQIDGGANDVEVPRFLLQPIVENAVQHGISKTAHGGRILLRAYEADEALTISILSPCPADGSERLLGHGVGLNNTRRRLEALYGSQGKLTVTRGVGDVRALISVPISRSAKGDS